MHTQVSKLKKAPIYKSVKFYSKSPGRRSLDDYASKTTTSRLKWLELKFQVLQLFKKCRSPAKLYFTTHSRTALIFLRNRWRCWNFCQPPYATACVEAKSVTRTLEGRSTDWATAPQLRSVKLGDQWEVYGALIFLNSGLFWNNF